MEDGQPLSYADSILPDWVVKWRRPVFSWVVAAFTCGIAIAAADLGHKNDENIIAYIIALIITVICIPIELAVERRNKEITKDLRFDLAGALISYGIIRIEATRNKDQIYFQHTSFQIMMDLFFFFAFLGAKMVGRTGTREVAMLIMADIVDYIELTFLINGADNVKDPSSATINAIVCFSFIFILVTLLIQRAETAGQKALNALVQGALVHLPIIFIRSFIGLNESGMPSFNLIFIAKNVVELLSCVMDFLEAGSTATRGEAAYNALP